MNQGVVNQSLVAIRREPFESSEMINQLLFGEMFTIIESYSGWLKILSSNDQYEGWLDSKLVEIIPDDHLPFEKKSEKVSNSFFQAYKEHSNYPLRLCPGSTIYNFSKGSFNVGTSKYNSSDISIASTDGEIGKEIIQVAELYINAPYLWGGRSPYGIDCSGLVQIVYKIAGILVPRDASQQVKLGETVDFINMVQPGDLAFFDNDEGIITHVGILTGVGKIIHSSGFVRMDNLDHQGIFNPETQSYTHKLRVIKRII